jgi:DNA-binding transcriptional ArsR family regulator
MAAVPEISDSATLTEHADTAARLLKALANPVRLQILCTL